MILNVSNVSAVLMISKKSTASVKDKNKNEVSRSHLYHQYSYEKIGISLKKVKNSTSASVLTQDALTFHSKFL